jgi:hypothetical protein
LLWTADLGDDWLRRYWENDDTSCEQIEAKVQEKQVAALKRERALAYARTQQV